MARLTQALPGSPFIVGICDGPCRAGDVASWVVHESRGAVVYVGIDLLQGGHEHDILRVQVQEGLKLLVAAPKCVGLVLQLSGAPWSAALFNHKEPNAPKPMFTQEHPGGVPGTHPARLAVAIDTYTYGVSLARVGLESKPKFVVLSEHPVSQASHSPYYSRGLEQHLTLHGMPLFQQLATEFGR